MRVFSLCVCCLCSIYAIINRITFVVCQTEPEEPFLELEGRRLADQATITVRENNVITLHCVTRSASPPVRRVYWYLADRNLSQSSQLLMEYSAEKDSYDSISVLVTNITRQLHKKIVICQVYHSRWAYSAVISASFNVLCKWRELTNTSKYPPILTHKYM